MRVDICNSFPKMWHLWKVYDNAVVIASYANAKAEKGSKRKGTKQNKYKHNSGLEWYSIKCNMLQTFYKCMDKDG